MRGKKTGKIFLIGAVLVIIAVLTGICVKYIRKESEKDSIKKQAVYVEDHLLCYTPDIKKEDLSVVICQLKYDEEKKWIYYWGDGIRLSEDGKYLYFLNEVDADGNGELCRIKTNRISENETKNGLFIEKLDTNVKYYQILERSEQVVYMQADGRLLHFSENREFVAKPADRFYICEDKVIYTTEQAEAAEGDSLYTIYAYDVNTGSNEKLESDITDFYKDEKSDFILCSRKHDKGEDIYVLDAEGQSTKIAENASYYWSGLDGEKKEFYYRKAEKSGELEVFDIYKYMDGMQTEKILDNVINCYVDAEHELFIYSKITEDAKEPQFYYKWKGQEGVLDIDKPGFWFAASEDEKSLMIGRDDEEASMVLYENTGSGLKKVKEIDKNTSLAGWKGNICYYYGNADLSKNTGDLYYYENGETKKLIEDVYMSVKMYADGNYLGYRNYVFDRGGELYLFDAKGKETKLAEEAFAYTYMEKDCILYMEDENLYIYTDGKSRIVGRNVLGYRCDELEGDYL